MKVLTLIAIYIASFIIIFLMISIIPYVFGYLYLEIVHDRNWQFLYTIFLGWWLSSFPAREYYMKHESLFTNIM